MGFSPLANMSRRIPHGNRQSRRNSHIRGFTIHHQSGVNAHGEASNPRREVSANYWITNEGAILPNIDESMRAWTTGAPGYPGGAASDHRNITVEVSNSPAGIRNGTYAISNAAMNSLIRLIADVHKRHKLGSVRRGTGSGVAVHRDFVPTACPGPYIMGRLGSIISEAERVRRGKAPTPAPTPIPQKEDDDGMYKPTVHVRTQGNFEATRAHPEIGKDLKAGQSRKSGNVTVFRGYEVTTNKSVATAWARTHAKGSGQETSRTNRSGYIAIQKEAQRISLEIVG